MKNRCALLGVLGICTLITAPISRKAPSTQIQQAGSKAGLGAVAPVCIMPAARFGGALKIRATTPIALTHSAIDQHPSEAVKDLQIVPLWLSELNRWRRMAGLGIVSENARLSYGSEQHARYLIDRGPVDASAFRAYDRNIGLGAHLEKPGSRFYTISGAQAAIGGQLSPDIIQGADVAWEGRNEAGDVDNLIVAPFHRLSLLAPWAQVGGYGSFGEYPRRAAALALRGPLIASQNERPIEFPPAASSISIDALNTSEWPNPIASCSGYERPVGLPITLQLGRRLLLRSHSLRDQTLNDALDACGFDAASYRNLDPTQQKRGRELLDAYGAVMLIPHKSLSLGHEYKVMLETSRGSFEWTFGINGAVETTASEPQPPPTRQLATSR